MILFQYREFERKGPSLIYLTYKYFPKIPIFAPCRVGSVGSVSASRTKDHHKNGTNCLPAWHAMRRVGVWQCSPTV